MKIMLLLFLTFLIACNQPDNLSEKAKKEILAAEKAFMAMAGEAGIQQAFTAFADENAVIDRNGLVSGPDSIASYYEGSNDEKVRLVWTPDFVDAARSGDLGYTYGKYTFYSMDSLGNTNEATGIFHTVWKKQKDGSWKYVWD